MASEMAMPRVGLADLLLEYPTIATIGLCKNAGKTTVLNHLVEQYRQDLVLGITSIGYDGEEADAVTLLPKPRIMVYPGMLITTTASCLQKTEVAYQSLHSTGIVTSLGEISIVRALSAGYMEVSGPSISAQAAQVGQQMLALGCQKVIVDGAAGRLSFASHADCAILSVGAALSSELTRVVKHASHLAGMLTLSACKRCGQAIPVDQTYRAELVDGTLHLLFRGAMVDRDLEAIMKEHQDSEKVAVVNDAAAVFVSPKVYAKYQRSGGVIQVRQQINLVALTINPMSPYGPWFDEVEFMQAMQQATKLPVYNILNEKVKS